MSVKLNFDALNVADASSTERQWRSRDVNPVMQMSLRMTEVVYERFRQHCRTDRRTNGEMLEIMMEAYERDMKRAD